MRRHGVAAIAVLALAVVAGCTGDDSEAATTGATEPPATTRPASEGVTTTTGIPPPVTEPDAPPCLAGSLRFQQEGNAGISPSSGSDAAILSGIRWMVEDGCERILLSLATEEGAPATEPPTVASFFIRDSGVLRVSLGPEVSGSAVSEHLVDSDLVDRAFVVRSLDGTIFVDLHLAQPAFARVSGESSPATAVVDLRPGGPDYEGSPVRQGEVLVVEPVTGEAAYPFSVTGYLRTGDETIEGRLTGNGDTVLVTGSAGAQGDTWGAYALLFADGPEGSVTVDVAGTVALRLRTG